MGWLHNILFTEPVDDAHITHHSGYLRLLDIIAGKFSGQAEQNCPLFAYFTIRIHVIVGVALFFSGVGGTYAARQLIRRYRDANEVTDARNTTSRVSHHVQGARTRKLSLYGQVERRRLETGINSALAKVEFSRRSVERQFRLSGWYASHADQQIDELSVDMLRDRLNAVRHDRHTMKGVYTRQLYELSGYKRRLRESKKRVSNSRAVISLLEDSDDEGDDDEIARLLNT